MKVQTCAVLLLVVCASYAFGAPSANDDSTDLGDPREAHLEERSDVEAFVDGLRGLADHLESASHQVSKRAVENPRDPTFTSMVRDLYIQEQKNQAANPTSKTG